MKTDLTQFESFVFDCDGTLLGEGQMDMPPEAFRMIRWLRQNGKNVAVASGRQVANLQNLFAPVADCGLYLIGENGNVAVRDDALIHHFAMPREDAYAIAHAIKDKNPAYDCIVSGIRKVYFWHRGEGRPVAIDHDVYIYEIVDDLDKIQEPIVKVTLYTQDGVAPLVPEFKERYGDPYHAAISGEYWLDFNLANKGDMLEYLGDHSPLEQASTVVFGDNWNDLEMLDWAARSYIKESSDPGLEPYAEGRVGDVPRFVAAGLDADFLTHPEKYEGCR